MDEERCGVTSIDVSGREWVCILHVHAPTYHRRTGDRTHRRGDLIIGSGSGSGRASQADRHWFQKKYPGRSEP